MLAFLKRSVSEWAFSRGSGIRLSKVRTPGGKFIQQWSYPHNKRWWITPTAHDAEARSRSPEGWRKRVEFWRSNGHRRIVPANLWETLVLVESGLPLTLEHTSPEQFARARVSGDLNPDWVETLMGFPVGWTDLAEE